MSKFHMGQNPLRGCYLILSNGAVADMTSNTAGEAIENYNEYFTITIAPLKEGENYGNTSKHYNRI